MKILRHISAPRFNFIALFGAFAYGIMVGDGVSIWTRTPFIFIALIAAMVADDYWGRE